MISILIPVYNSDIVELARTLSIQIQECKIQSEIIFLDDNSSEDYKSSNADVLSFPFVRYEALSENSGRLKVRKLLSGMSRNEYLLFIDGDSRILNPDFIASYIFILEKGFEVYTGGRLYDDTRPLECSKVLHWKYGHKRERVLTGKTAFMTNNFMIRKNLFDSLNFPEDLDGYGHEDTWLGIELEKKGKRIFAFNNPVYHNGIEYTKVFLEKINNSLKNLHQLVKISGEPAVRRHVKLYRYFSYLRKLKLTSLFLNLSKLFFKPLLSNLYSCHPSLTLFDFYRMTMLIQFFHIHEENKFS